MEDKVDRKRAPRRVATKTVTRKAPARAVESVATERSGLFPLIAIGVFVVVVGGSIAVGFSDEGQINIANTMNQKKSSGTVEEQEQMKNIPVQQTRTAVPDGGLVPTSDVDPASVPPPVVATSTASSTETATSTESAPAEATETTDEVAPADTPLE